jgi:hypothetical protein
MIPKEVIEDWIKNKKRIQDRLNRIRKRMKKFAKKEKHFAMRLNEIKKYEDEQRRISKSD